MLPVLFLLVKRMRKARALSPVPCISVWGGLQPSVQQAVEDTRGDVRCTDVAQKPNMYLLASPFRKGNC